MTAALAPLLTILTAPHVETVEILDPVSSRREKIEGVRDGLLVELGQAVATGMERSTGGRSAPSERLLLASGAFDLHSRIQGELVGDMTRLDVRIRYGTLADICQQWAEAFQASHPTAGEVAEWVTTLESWVTEVEALLSPPQKAEISEGCPICGGARVVTDDAVKAAVVLTWRRARPIESVELVCHWCGPVAKGLKAVAATLRIGGPQTGAV